MSQAAAHNPNCHALQSHIDKCELRYQHIDFRFDQLEKRLTKLEHLVQAHMFSTIIGMFTIITLEVW